MSDPTKPIRALTNHAGGKVTHADPELPGRELAQRRRPTSMDDIRRLRGRVNTHLDRLEEAALTDGSIAVQRGGQIAGVLATLIGDAAKLDGSGRATLRAAIEYFIVTDDRNNDLAGPTGLDDDLDVLRAAVIALGRQDLLRLLA